MNSHGHGTITSTNVAQLAALHDREGMRAFTSYMGWRPLEIERAGHRVLIRWPNWSGRGADCVVTFNVADLLFDEPPNKALKYRPIVCALLQAEHGFGRFVGAWMEEDFAQDFERALGVMNRSGAA